MVYRPPKELLSNNRLNLIGEVMTKYTKLLKLYYKFTTPYYLRINGKDLYLVQALFTVRIRIHSTSSDSPYSLLFGKHLRVTTDGNEPRPLALDGTE
ncbi:hypothetical protein LPUS_06304 [Lasallia pustulata]|uniref:Uncharacterized protein n=1 Tax=Lasallia pustulata TaxID=136370 RepID=A0A1W5D0U3_9LECA|nr:hypothetical protein LPUS_06304 [Lasallia pustulata]